jgi:photosystem II stability/assembly factor-like uncharacterized protein
MFATNAGEKLSVRGVYRSTDDGDTWTDSSEGLVPKKRHYYTAIVFSPGFAQDRTVWLTGHKTGLQVSEPYGGMWESTDGGKTWTELDYKGFPYREMTTRVSQDIIGLVVSPKVAQDGLMVAAAAGEGIYQSKDRGRNWELLNPVKDVLGVYAPPTFPDEPLLALATTGQQVMVSTDGGKTFVSSGKGLPEDMRAVRGVAFSENFARDRKMFCYGQAGVFASEDAGASWKQIAAPEGTASVSAMAAIGDFQTYGAIAFGTDDARVYLSEDMGKSFTSLNSESLLSYGIDTIAFPPDYKTDPMIYTSSQDGVYRYALAKSGKAQAIAQAAAAGVDATRVARATTVAGLEFVPEKSDRVETGCVAYLFAPALPLAVLAGRRLWRRPDHSSADAGQDRACRKDR